MLIYPRVSPDIIYGKIRDVGTSQMPLGIAYIGAYLREKGFEVKILDADVLRLEDKEVLKEIKKFAPEMIAFSSTTPVINSAILLAEKIKKTFPGILLVIGGPHSTGVKGAVVKNKCFDIAVIGEGEITTAEIAANIAKGKNPFDKKTKGIAFRKGKNIFRTAPRPLIEDIDSLPFPARNLMPQLNLYRQTPASCRRLPVGNLITSRGCPYRCVYCDRSTFGNKFRTRSPENIVEEISELVNVFGAKELKFWDDVINFDRKRLIEVCKLMIKCGLVVPWVCIARTMPIDDELLDWMKKSGCWQIAYGIESGNDKILSNIKKAQTTSIVRQAVEKTVKHGIRARGFFMLGLPGDTEETMQQTIDFAKSLPLDTVSIYITTILPGTELWETAFASGEAIARDWDNFSMNVPDKPTYVTKGLSEELLRKYLKRAYQQFYLRPSYVWQRFKSIRSLEELKMNFAALKSILQL